MAKHDALFTSGRIGNVIFYRWKGIGCARVRPGRVRQTKATKQSAKDFGRAVTLSSFLRSSLSPGLRNYRSREIMYKINAALLGWLRQEKPLEAYIPFVGLELNDKSAFGSRLKKELLIDFQTKGKLLATLPRLKIPDDITAPSNTSLIRVDIAVAGCMLNLPRHTDAAAANIEIPYKDGWMPAITKELKFECKAGSINIVVASLHYLTKKDGQVKEIADDRWAPAAIVAAAVGPL